MQLAVSNIQQGVGDLYTLLDKELSQDWKTYAITIEDVSHEINPQCEPAVRDMVIKQLLKDAVWTYINHIHDEEYQGNPFLVIQRILNGARKEDHQFEIYKAEIVSNLDENGNPITAKPLNEDSIYVQWQDERKYPSFDEYLKTRLTEEEIVQIEQEARKEVLELKGKSNV